MWLGWDHCGYDTIDDEPGDPENSMAWHPPPSGRGERGVYNDARHKERMAKGCLVDVRMLVCRGLRKKRSNFPHTTSTTPLSLPTPPCWSLFVSRNLHPLLFPVHAGGVCACDCLAQSRAFLLWCLLCSHRSHMCSRLFATIVVLCRTGRNCFLVFAGLTLVYCPTPPPV